jgi:hypothetical protein
MATYRTISISELTPGSTLAIPVFDQHFVKLLDVGSTIDQRLLDRLKAMGISEVTVESSATKIVHRPATILPAGIEVQPLTGEEPRIDRCSSCGAIIALRPPSPDSQAATWICKSCGAVYFGSVLEDEHSRGVSLSEHSGIHTTVAPVKVKWEPTAPSIPPENVQRLVKSLVPDDYTGPDRRQHKRYAVAVPVVALPLAADFRIDGEPVQMTTANVSLGGAALIHTRFVDAPVLP